MAKLNINAKNALAELRALITEVNNLKAELSKMRGTNSDTFIGLETSSKKLKTQIGLLGNKINYLEAILKKQNNQIKSNTTNVNKNTKSISKNNKEKNKSIKANKTLNDSYKKLTSIFGTIAGTALFVNILKETYETIKTFDSLGFALERVTQTTEDYESSSRFLLSLTKDFGVELVSTTNRWIKFLAAAKNAGLSLSDTENIFRSMTKAAGVLGLKTDELQGIYLALEQMLSKGKVTTEELRRQLGERLPGAMGIMAASIGVTIPKLDEMLRKGEVMSAEVLPKFADAVEVAFGIETVDKIDTIVAAENRAIASWQGFIKGISNSENIINKALRGILNGFAGLANDLTFLFSGPNQQLQIKLTEEEKIITKRLKGWAKTRLDLEKDYAGKEEELRNQIEIEKEKLRRTSNSDERKQINDHLDILQSDLVKYNQEVKEETKKIAKEKFNEALLEFEKQKELIEKARSIDKDARENPDTYLGGLVGIARPEEAVMKKLGKSIQEIEVDYLNAAAAYSVYRKLVEESDVEVIDNENKKLKTREKILKDILTLEKERQIQIAKSSINSNNSRIKSDNVGFEEKIKLEKSNNILLNRIAELQYSIEQEKARKNFKIKNEELDKALKDGLKIVGDVDKQRIDLQTRLDNQLIIAEEKRNSKIISNNESTSDKILKIIDDINNARLADVQDPFNIEIAALKRGYEESNKTLEDRKILEKELKRIAIESANAQIDAQITLLKAQLAVKDQSIDTINAIIRKINELEAARKNLINDDESDPSAFWDQILSIASDYTNAIGDLVDATYNRRIENINAEIEAERKKYDELIALAEGDEEQQKTLERNKAERIEQLEKKRLKQEQKQARARKAFAVADIAVSTAQAIMRAYSDTGPIAGTVLAGLIAALGAVQIATVLSQPIPQYKEGGNITKDETAMINDGIHQEYVERNGQILTTKTKNAVVNLKANDVVYKNYDDMINKSKLPIFGISEVGFGHDINERDFNRFFTGMQSSVTKGFKKAKINNNIIVKESNNNYAESISRWN